MKKHGFTLIEIIVVIALLSMIGVGTTIVITKVNDPKEKNVLKENQDKFRIALDVYLSNHNEVVNNINNTSEGAIISLELLKNEGLIKGDLKINYEDNYYIVTNALLSNENLTEECDNSIELNIIASWVDGKDTSEVLYFCPKKTPDADDTPVDLETQACKDINYNKDTLAYNIICNSKKNAFAMDGMNKSINSMVTTMNKMTLNNSDDINDAYNQLKESVDSYFNNSTIYDENATKTIRRSSSHTNDILSSYLSKKEDDGGYSYYYRDKPNDNYVNFAGMCWRIYRIDGYGNIKMILRDKDKECPGSSATNRSLGIGNFGYKKTTGYPEMYIYDYLNPELNSDTAMSNILKNFQEDTLNKKIKNTYGDSYGLSTFLANEWCIDNRLKDNLSYEEAIAKRKENIVVSSLKSSRDYSPTFKCQVEKTTKFSNNINMYVASVTYDEVMLGKDIFAERGGERFWTLNIAGTGTMGLGKGYQGHQHIYTAQATYSTYVQNYWMEIYQVRVTGGDVSYGKNENVKIIPVIQLKADTKIESGTGLLNDPYIIKTN